jgi:uncharacterized protein DUF5681
MSAHRAGRRGLAAGAVRARLAPHDEGTMTDEHQGGRRRARPTGDYEVGYGKPPVASRFKPGQSGNPSGGRKRLPAPPQSLGQLIRAALDAPVAVGESDAPAGVSRREALARVLVARALAGEPRALAQLLKLIKEHEPEPPGDPVQKIILEIVDPNPHDTEQVLPDGDGGDGTGPTHA